MDVEYAHLHVTTNNPIKYEWNWSSDFRGVRSQDCDDEQTTKAKTLYPPQLCFSRTQAGSWCLKTAQDIIFIISNYHTKFQPISMYGFWEKPSRNFCKFRSVNRKLGMDRFDNRKKDTGHVHLTKLFAKFQTLIP